MNTKNRLLIYILGGFLFFIDQFLKYFFRTNPEKIFVWNKILGFEYFENTGVAFNIPLPNLFVVFATPLLIFGFFIFLLKKGNKKFLHNPAAALILFGAVSNYIDRVIFGFTVDYIRFFTSIINLADLMIVAGVILLITKHKE